MKYSTITLIDIIIGSLINLNICLSIITTNQENVKINNEPKYSFSKLGLSYKSSRHPNNRYRRHQLMVRVILLHSRLSFAITSTSQRPARQCTMSDHTPRRSSTRSVAKRILLYYFKLKSHKAVHCSALRNISRQCCRGNGIDARIFHQYGVYLLCSL